METTGLERRDRHGEWLLGRLGSGPEEPQQTGGCETEGTLVVRCGGRLVRWPRLREVEQGLFPGQAHAAGDPVHVGLRYVVDVAMKTGDAVPHPTVEPLVVRAPLADS